jgi:hypothetical protein
MSVEDWLKMASADAARRGLPDVVPLLEALAQAARALRAAAPGGRADDAAGH